jgi:hypothetical protein
MNEGVGRVRVSQDRDLSQLEHTEQFDTENVDHVFL